MQELCQCNVFLWVDFNGARGASTVSAVKMGVSYCAAQSSVFREDAKTDAAMFSNLNVQSLQDAALESKLDNFENGWVSLKGLPAPAR